MFLGQLILPPLGEKPHGLDLFGGQWCVVKLEFPFPARQHLTKMEVFLRHEKLGLAQTLLFLEW